MRNMYITYMYCIYYVPVQLYIDIAKELKEKRKAKEVGM